MPFAVYFIKSADGLHYIGHTPDVKRRLQEHNDGMCHSTKHGKNWKIVYTESFLTRSEAMKREKWFKSGAGREWAKKNIAGWSPPSAE